MKAFLQKFIIRAFLQIGLGVTFGYMFAAAYRNRDFVGAMLMLVGAVVAFVVFSR